ncbi:MAG: sirohydrochlorin chelatase [Planctomycetia bacterium]|nr:sirohydrochlorin chelatase [Planctomycetia bacterium]
MAHAVLIAGHGSRDPDGIAEFLELVQRFRLRRPAWAVEAAFLEFARPTVQEGIDRLAQAGATGIVVLPGVLLAAGHAKNDLASEVRLARERYPQLDIRMGNALDVDADLLQLCRLRYREALATRPAVEAEDTLLLLVARGSSDADANSTVAKVARFLQEGYPTGWAAWAYSGVARPLLEEALPICERMGFRRLVVQPYFLFTGVLLKRIHAQAAVRQQARPDLEIIVAPHLQAHPLLLDAFEQRLNEAMHGTAHMNCSLCQYRVPIIGREDRLGEPQSAHHHHVEGLLGHTHGAPAKIVASEDPPGVHPWDEALLDRLRF